MTCCICVVGGALRLSIYLSTFQVPIAWLSLCDVLCIIILLPLFDRVIYPAMDRRGYSPSVRSRIILGMLFSVAAILSAGGLEAYRLKWFNDGHMHEQTIGEFCKIF